MNQLSSEHLEELTDEANRRLLEFGVGKFDPVPAGVVRILHDIIKKWYQEKEESWAMQRISEVTITAKAAMKLSEQGYERGHAAAKREVVPTNGNGHDSLPDPDVARDNIANMLANGGGGALASTITKPRTLAEVDDVVLPAVDNAAKSEQLREIIHELQDMAVDEVMPTMAFWDNAKPPHLPKAQALLMRHLLTWNRLAEYARLEISPRAFKSKRKVTGRAVADDAGDEGEP